MKDKNKLNYFLTNLNVVNIIIGYTFSVSLIIPLLGNNEGVSRLVTVPYRGVSLLIALLVVFFNIKSNIKKPLALKLFFFFWLWVLVRIYYDIEVRTDYFVLSEHKVKIWLIAIAGCLLPMISLYKSIKFIDFNYCFKLLYIGCIIILIPSIFFSLSSSIEGARATGNLALDPISFAAIGVTTSLLCIYKIVVNENKSFLKVFVNTIFAILGLYIALRSGSRGPVLGFVIVILFWFSYKRKKGIIFFSIFIFAAYALRFFFITILGYFSPLIAFRIRLAISGDDLSMSARQDSYIWFLDKIAESPLLGSQFARLGYGDYPGYAHSIFLDLLLGFGVIGLLVFMFVILKAIKSLTKHIILKDNYWVGLIMLQYFLLAVSSGAFYTNPILNCLIVLTLLVSVKRKQLMKSTLKRENA